MAAKTSKVDEKLHSEVQDMLVEMFQSSSVPEYDVNSATTEMLHRVLTLHKKKINENEIFIKHCKREDEYYAAEAKKLEAELKSIGFSYDDLDQETKVAVESLAEAAVILDLKEPTETNFMLGIHHMVREKMKLSEEKRVLSREQTQLAKLHCELSGKFHNLQKELDTLTKKNETLSAEGNRRQSQKKFLDNKVQEYVSKAQELQKKLENAGCNPTIYHSQLLKEHGEIEKMEEKLKEINLKLESYHNLPPNEELAKVKVEEAKAELAHLQRLMEQKIEQKARELI